MHDPTERARRRRAWLLALACLVVAAPGWSQPQEGTEDDLRATVRERFEVLPLRSGVLLRPLAVTADYRAIEITGAGVAVDGDLLADEELAQRLGADSALVARLADQDAEHLATLLGEPGGETAALEPVEEEPVAERDFDRHERPRVRSDARVSVGSSLTVEEDEEARDVVVIGGSLDIEGEVLGDAVAVGGSVSVDGRVTGDVVAVGGGVVLGPEAYVLGDAVSVGGRIERDPAARVEGDVSEVAFAPVLNLGWLRFLDRDRHFSFDLDDHEFEGPLGRMTETVGRIAGVVVLGLLACLALLIARRPIERMEARIEQEAWQAGLTGLVAQILFVPLLVLILFVLVVSVVGIPLLLLVPFALLALLLGGFAGFTAVAYRLGRWVEGRFGWRPGSPYVALLVGLVSIQAWTFVGHALDLGLGALRAFSLLLVFLGLLVQYLAWTVGFGAFLLTRFGTQSAWSARRSQPLDAPVAPALTPPAPLESRPEPTAGDGPSEP